MRRKLFSYVLAYIAGIAAGNAVMWSDVLTASVIGIAFIFTVLLSVKAFRLEKACVVASAIGFIFFSIFTLYFENSPVNHITGEEAKIEAKISGAQKKRNGQAEYICSIRHVESGSISFDSTGEKILVRDKQGKIPFEKAHGGYIKFTCTITKPELEANPGGFSYRKYLYGKGVGFTCETAVISDFRETGSFVDAAKNRIISVRERFLNSLSDENLRNIMRSVVFGESSALSEDVYSRFQKNGTAHVLAVSGLHIGVLYGCYAFLKKKTGFSLLMPGFVMFLIIYGTCAMWAVSVKRAVLLIFLKLIAEYTDRPFDLSTGTCAAAFIVCMANPYTAFSAGFQLSFLAVCILSFVPRAVERVSTKKAYGPFIIQILLAPYICHVFNYFSVSGFIANIPVIFIISIFVPAGIFSFLFYIVSGAVFPLSEKLLAGLGNLTVWINDFFYFDGKGAWDVKSEGVYAVVFVYLVIFFLSSENFTIDVIRRSVKRISYKVCVILLASIMIWVQGFGVFFRNETEKMAPYGLFRKSSIVFTDMNKAECTHVRLCGGIDILIDGGGNQAYNTGEKGIKPYLLKNGVDNIDAAIPTAIDKRHYLGLFQLSRCFDVKENLLWAKAGDVISAGEGGRVEVLWPESFDLTNLSSADNRKVIKVDAGSVSCIIYGGLDEKNEKAFIEKYLGTDSLCCDIVKISFPEDGIVSAEAFLDIAKPEFAVISASGVGRDGLDEIIENIRKKDIILYRTDILGAVGIIGEKEKIRVCTQQKNMRLKYLMKN